MYLVNRGKNYDIKNVVQLQKESVYPKGQADMVNWQSQNQCLDMWSSTVLSKLKIYKKTRNLTTYEQ
jgi:hypothetical protein